MWHKVFNQPIEEILTLSGQYIYVAHKKSTTRYPGGAFQAFDHADSGAVGCRQPFVVVIKKHIRFRLTCNYRLVNGHLGDVIE